MFTRTLTSHYQLMNTKADAKLTSLCTYRTGENPPLAKPMTTRLEQVEGEARKATGSILLVDSRLCL